MEWVSWLEAVARAPDLDRLAIEVMTGRIRVRWRNRTGFPLIPAQWPLPCAGEKLQQLVEVHAGDLLAAFGPADPPAVERASTPERRGRKPQYDWTTAEREIFGRLYRGEISERSIETQADVERVLADWFAERTGDEPSESMIRSHAAGLYKEILKGR